ncbi:hypothetical protein GOP47_0014417 [Adiantum capillus-veneris]|uniref:FAD/NAD(P)-binding domain-containing protein n=1 Tax=Adiantum capillus-veneris TaxID=13818 RepID=A0A9D4ZCF6_ADICA|nr:hypothetical protein GOP47_0014417 [Adiantum capillus-veneris]
MSALAERKRVVVVGGGIGGAFSAKLLEDSSDVTLIDPKDHLEIPYGQLRCTVQPDFAERSLVLHSEYLKKARHILGFAECASVTEVVTSTGDILPYDFLVIATGSTHKGPSTKAERIKEFQSENKKLKEAKKTLIIGGGPVGVELAGEIVVDFPEKKVVLAHGGDRLIEFLGPKASSKTFSWLKKKHVDIRLHEKVNLDSVSASSHVYTTSSGDSIEADCHFLCVGKKISSSWMQSTVLGENLDENGRLKVDDYLRVEGHSNIFAVGDITAIKEIKQGFLAGKHAEVVADNVKRLSQDPDSKLNVYKPLATPMGIVSLGRRIAVAQLPFGTILGWIPGMLKSKDLFVGKTRKTLGLNS